MASSLPPIQIGIVGFEPSSEESTRPWAIWQTGFPAAVVAAGAEPVILDIAGRGKSWTDRLRGLQGLVYAGNGSAPTAAEEALLRWCRDRKFPLLAIDNGMLGLNATFGGGNFQDLAHEMPQALQHRHPPEQGLRHAINIEPGTLLAELYGEGEFFVNSQHRRGIGRLAKGFVVSARALDGVVEAMEWEDEAWFALAVQWRPASAFASGLDIQLFRGLVDRCAFKTRKPVKPQIVKVTPRKRPLAKCG